jgi:osmotically-inducible protein OsmY
MHRVLLFAMSSALIGFTGCNKSSQEKASEKSAEIRKDADKAMEDIKENAQKATEKVEKEAKQAAGEIKENAAEARQKIANETGKLGDSTRDRSGEAKNDAKAEARQADRDVRTEARQTNRDVHEALGLDQSKTTADKKLNERIRAALKRDKTAARDAGDVTLETRDGHVRLKGTVASEEAKKAIASQARKVAGLTHVSDDIKVAERVGQGSSD